MVVQFESIQKCTADHFWFIDSGVTQWISLCCLAKNQASCCLSVSRNDPVSSVVCIFYGLFGFGTMIVHFLTFIIEIGCFKDNNINAVSATGRVLHVVFLVCSDNFYLAFVSIHTQAKLTCKLLSFRYPDHKCCIISLDFFWIHLWNSSAGEIWRKSYHK